MQIHARISIRIRIYIRIPIRCCVNSPSNCDAVKKTTFRFSQTKKKHTIQNTIRISLFSPQTVHTEQ